MGHFKMHIISVHEGQKPFKCSVCNNCSRKWVLTQLIALVHEGKKPLDCSICNYSCSQKGTLIKHIATLHEGKKTFKCSICDYCSSEKEQLKNENTHFISPRGQKTIQMFHLWLQLFKKVALNSAHTLHQIMMIKKTFACSICEYNSSTKQKITVHIATIHESTALKCSICDFKFPLKGRLTRHIASVPEGKRPFMCSICDFTCLGSFLATFCQHWDQKRQNWSWQMVYMRLFSDKFWCATIGSRRIYHLGHFLTILAQILSP